MDQQAVETIKKELHKYTPEEKAYIIDSILRLKRIEEFLRHKK